MIRLMILLLAAFALSGCKIEIVVPNGGNVVSASGAYGCAQGERCIVEVSDIFFDETFIAEPRAGYRFAGWKKRDRGLCGGRLGDCELETSAFEGNPVLMMFLEADEVFYLEPVFEVIPVNSNGHLLLYGGVTSDYYLGCITCTRLDPESICNSNSIFGSPRAVDSIWNRFGDFGSTSSELSPWNRFASYPPAIFDQAGLFYGYLTANTADPQRTRLVLLQDLADYAADGRYTLQAVQDWFCN
ncbi:hypothetical protein F0M18_04885 [Pseudohalioglobus sediminis]|uniref:Bacterial repeat domain-containing protein n=1 Tax=Pseudohalioglobus sediminis TaxID=2606449 RepID=A0A5B0X4H3_9GAMM|nr:hypothetical protein [Pseudohalioglobus sediminis]KAA1193181.1 hypothetical protein F0M18_04885 [Pseudohalioglobus sediminis]